MISKETLQGGKLGDLEGDLGFGEVVDKGEDDPLIKVALAELGGIVEGSKRERETLFLF